MDKKVLQVIATVVAGVLVLVFVFIGVWCWIAGPPDNE